MKRSYSPRRPDPCTQPTTRARGLAVDAIAELRQAWADHVTYLAAKHRALGYVTDADAIENCDRHTRLTNAILGIDVDLVTARDGYYAGLRDHR